MRFHPFAIDGTESNDPSPAAVGVFLACALVIFLLPTLIAAWKRAPNLGKVVLINLLLGWSMIGWAVALVMSLRHRRSSSKIGKHNEVTTPAFVEAWSRARPSTAPVAPPRASRLVDLRPPLTLNGQLEGWYTDPLGGPMQRYHDGVQWTESLRDAVTRAH